MLELRAATKTYDDGHPVHALRETSLTVEEGDYVAITGASGSGKSTLLNLLGLLDVPTTGSYRVLGLPAHELAESHRGAVRGQVFGFIFQNFHLLNGRSALENVELGMLYGPYNRRERRRRAWETVERLGLAHRALADPRRMSGGERQRVAVARAVAGRPRVLFCDEPTGNLDSANTATVLDTLRGLNEEGLTVVVVTHDPGVAAEGRRRIEVSDGTVTEVEVPA
ncbi:ABC transporter ATP-binding protein [Paractinoplanes globisporus]|jgi:putative ABC transport system ATP-binding protein|uniref:ABC transporter ATP-binding protein n=1 Tax=Paractinoplanes globisporus TaxID=113565 RepID=A0ABW6W766_9ACTN|nr:ABC transporter ATP-binding protein [Actinoplanes globisporus]